MISADSVATPIVDWLSIVVPLPGDTVPRSLPIGSVNMVVVAKAGAAFLETVFTGEGWQSRGGRRPYSDGYANDGRGIYVWGGGHPNVCIEFTGAGCQYLRDTDSLSTALSAFTGHITRLDIAIDSETDVRPIDFAKDRVEGRIKSFGTQKSESGETCYIGSKSSEQYARVYRYEPPHPRAKYLRIETVSRKHYANAAAQSILENGISYAAQQTMNRYQFNQIEDIDTVDGNLPAPYRDRTLSKTEAWLIKQAAPAFRKLVDAGEIEDPWVWLFEHFWTEDMQKDVPAQPGMLDDIPF